MFELKNTYFGKLFTMKHIFDNFVEKKKILFYSKIWNMEAKMLDENRNINPSKMSSLSIYKEYVGLLFTHIYCNY